MLGSGGTYVATLSHLGPLSDLRFRGSCLPPFYLSGPRKGLSHDSLVSQELEDAWLGARPVSRDFEDAWLIARPVYRELEDSWLMARPISQELMAGSHKELV